MRYERSVMQKICESVTAAATARRFTTGGLQEERVWIRHAKSHFVSSLPDFRISNPFVTVKYAEGTRETRYSALIAFCTADGGRTVGRGNFACLLLCRDITSVHRHGGGQMK